MFLEWVAFRFDQTPWALTVRCYLLPSKSKMQKCFSISVHYRRTGMDSHALIYACDTVLYRTPLPLLDLEAHATRALDGWTGPGAVRIQYCQVLVKVCPSLIQNITEVIEGAD
jgi:hypothetical protein